MKTRVFVVGAITASAGIGLLMWGLAKPAATTGIGGRGPEVYAVLKRDGTGWPADQVNRIASEYGGRVATGAQISESRDLGAEWCVPTWVADDAGGNYTAVWPIPAQEVPAGCAAGTVPNAVNYAKPSNAIAGVAVYGVKPARAKSEHRILPFNATMGKWLQSS